MSLPIAVYLAENSNGIADCPGYKSSGVGCDIRESGNPRLDLALFVADTPCGAAGVFTLNDICAAPVDLCKEIVGQSGDNIAGCVINSGNANACTGEQGRANAEVMVQAAQKETGIDAPFLVCSTGRIGRQLPMGAVKEGIAAAAKHLDRSAASSLNAADAILTSDTRRKVATAQFEYKHATITVAGMAKGAGMIEPNMATMLAFLVTDIKAESALLKAVIKQASDLTFNRISVDGDMSTNDTVLLFANGASGIAADETSELLEAFKKAVIKVCDFLAEKIVGDGEKVTKLVELVVKGCRTDSDAEKVARAVGNSLLVKTSWYGSDPNWGRLADAAGYARVGLQEDCFSIYYDDIPALINGKPQDERLADWKAIVARKRFRITLELNQGDGHYRLLASDLSEAYVDFNKSE
jgi:glutamate N-acetyltransferase/amino-acid N-acetyltransferase